MPGAEPGKERVGHMGPSPPKGASKGLSTRDSASGTGLRDGSAGALASGRLGIWCGHASVPACWRADVLR